MKLLFALVAIAIGLTIVTAEAKRPAHAAGKSATITIDQAAPVFGQTGITFTVSQSKYHNAEHFWLRNECYQGGIIVYAQLQPVVWDAAVETGTAGTFTLGPTPSWTGGAADCQAFFVDMFNNRNDELRSTATFYTVGP